MSELTRRRKSVLVVEDDPDIRDSFRDILELHQFAVVTADNGRDGLARLAQIERPSLILLDLQMPVMNGLEFLAALHADDRIASIPVVLVSAHGHPARHAHGVAGFLEKPFEPSLLLETVRRYA